MSAIVTEGARRAALEGAERRALALLDAIEAANLIAPGRSEREVTEDVYALALERFGVERHWHKRIVRTGANTVTTAFENPPLRTIESNDTVYVDLGPVFEEWEADVGRTYAIGADVDKQRLVADLERTFTHVQRHYRENPTITGAELYAHAQAAAADAGWTFGGSIAGHVIGEFPHSKMSGDRSQMVIAPSNARPLRSLDDLRRQKHWILEIHLVDRDRTFGGFYERLL